MSIEARIVRENEALEPYDYSIFVLGASGNGKSTLINSTASSIMVRDLSNLAAAIKCEKYPIIDPCFDDGTQERNDATSGQSQTTKAHFYKFRGPFTNNKTILIVDTPGLASSGGVDEDD